jgi:hypothetical protein
MKSIEERIRAAQNDITLMIAALSADTDHLDVTDGDVIDAALVAASRVHEELYWLHQLPADILNTDAPTDDERKAGAR